MAILVAAPIQAPVPVEAKEAGGLPISPPVETGGNGAKANGSGDDGGGRKWTTSVELTPHRDNLRQEVLIGKVGEYDLGRELDRKLFDMVEEVRATLEKMKKEGHQLSDIQKLLEHIFPDLEARAEGIRGLSKQETRGGERIFHSSEELVVALGVIERDEMLKAAGFAHSVTNGGLDKAVIDLLPRAEIEGMIERGFQGLILSAGGAVVKGVAGLIGVTHYGWQRLVTGRQSKGIEVEFHGVADRVMTDYWRITLAQMGGGDRIAAVRHLTEREAMRYAVYGAVGLDLRSEAHLAAIDLLHDPDISSATQGGGVSEMINARQRALVRELGGRHLGDLRSDERLAVQLKAVDDFGATVCHELTLEVEEAELDATKKERLTKSGQIEAIAVRVETGLEKLQNISREDVEAATQAKEVAAKTAADTKTAYDRIEELDGKVAPSSETDPIKSIWVATQAVEKADLAYQAKQQRYDPSVSDNEWARANSELVKLDKDEATAGSIAYYIKQARDLELKTSTVGTGLKGKAVSDALAAHQKAIATNKDTLEANQKRRARLTDEILPKYADELAQAKLKFDEAVKFRESLEKERMALIDGYFGGRISDVATRTKTRSEKDAALRKAEAEETRLREMLEERKVKPDEADKRKAKILRRIGQIYSAEQLNQILSQITEESIRQALTDPQTSYDYLLNLIFNSTATPEQMIDDPGMRQDTLTRAEIVMEAVKLYGLNIDQLGIELPDTTILDARFGTTDPHPVSLSDYTIRSVGKIRGIEREIATLRRKGPEDRKDPVKVKTWEEGIKALDDQIHQMRIEDELLLESAYDRILPYMRVNRHKTRDLVMKLVDKLADKALTKDPFRPSYELTQPNSGYLVEKAVHTDFDPVEYKGPKLLKHHGQVNYRTTDAQGIKHVTSVEIKKPDSPAAAGEVVFHWQVVMDQALWNYLQLNIPDRVRATTALLPQSLIDRLYQADAAGGNLLPADSRILDGRPFALTANPKGDSVRSFAEVDATLSARWYEVDNALSANYLAAVGKSIIVGDIPLEQQKQALKYFAGVDLASFGGRYMIIREADGELSVTGEIPPTAGGPASVAVNREPIGVFIDKYRDRWKAKNKPATDLDAGDIATIEADLNDILNNVGREALRATQSYP